mmetsp:Transcript_27832/g.24625  ORF Transcript_27832/g.24625 Transcript_27832/m.24625 type:complete len:288 (+) Transcript_27832:670-1533(+)
MSSWWVIFDSIGLYSVNVFFFLSAFLASYLMISKFNGKKIFNFGMIYLHRLIRVVPSILLFTVMVITFMEYTGSGPIWRRNVEALILRPCRKYWWTNIIFISSIYLEVEERCLGQLWYLSNEMIYFIFIPFIVLLYINKRKLIYLAMSFIIFSSIILNSIFSHIRGHSMTILKDPAQEWANEFYNYPFSRFGPYFIGATFGIMYYEWTKSHTDQRYGNTIGARFYNSVKNIALFRYTLFLISSIIMISLIILPKIELQDLTGRAVSQIPSDFFNALHRQLFVTAFGL